MTKDDEMFVPASPSYEVKQFLEKNPQAYWESSLRFLIETYPQVQDGQVKWVVEGGAAVRLHDPSRRIPNDVDIITREAEARMKKELVNVRRFGIKTIKEWLFLRDLLYTENKEEILFRHCLPLPFNGEDIWVLNPAALVVSKTIRTHRYAPPRLEDQNDIGLLLTNNPGVQNEVKILTHGLLQ